MKFLVVDDEVNVVSFIKKGLEEQSHMVDVSYDGSTCLKLAKQNEYDFYILDVIMPKMNGLDLCKEIRKLYPNVPIIMLTALKDTESVVDGLDAGADDYITKPFRFDELLARIRSVSRRKDNHSQATILNIADLVLNCDQRTTKRAGKIIKLTSKEFTLLEYLMRNSNRVLTRVQILENVWDINFDMNSNVVDVYMNYLRNKIDKGYDFQLLHTIVGVGYILMEEEK